jgi:hypothetical protein|nr:MAG TPA: Sporulation protein Cse60 [Caudoviricetes sp.]
MLNLKVVMFVEFFMMKIKVFEFGELSMIVEIFYDFLKQKKIVKK